MEVVRQKNAASYIVFPIVDADGDFVTGATGLDSEIDTWSDGAAPDGFTDCTNEATEIGSTGVYYLSLTQGELNVDYAVVQVKTTSSGAKTQLIVIRTLVGDPLLLSTTTAGTVSTAQTGDSYAIVNSGTHGNAALKTLIDAVDDFLDTEIAAILEDTGTTLDDLIDTEVAAIKAKTDSLTFTVANQVDANIQYINDAAVTGNGAGGTPWDAA